jgi:threonine/homoserine/homoserine lactone efflux protein
VLVSIVSGALRRPRVKAWIERVTGSVLVAFGLRLVTVTRP